MNKLLRNKLIGILIVPIGLSGALVPFSTLIGWNLLTMILFWFLIIPSLTFLLPIIFSKSRNHLIESIFGLVIFYGAMIIMIYDHHQTDYFKVMIISLVINSILLSIISKFRRQHPTYRWYSFKNKKHI